MDDGQKQTVNHIYHTLRDMLNKTMTYQATVTEIKHMLWYLETNFPKDMLEHEMGDRGLLIDEEQLRAFENEGGTYSEHMQDDLEPIEDNEDECEHPNLQESCPDGAGTDWQGSTWYCVDCGEYIHGGDED